MATTAFGKTPAWFRIVALIAIVWNLFGVFMYLHSVGMFGDPMADLDAAQRTAAESIPPAIKGAFAIGTFAGLIGSVGLLLRKRWAWPVLLVSLLALIVLEGWIVFLSGHQEAFGLGVPITVTLGAILLAWLANHARHRGWLA
jgi:hypothetical protein